MNEIFFYSFSENLYNFIGPQADSRRDNTVLVILNVKTGSSCTGCVINLDELQKFIINNNKIYNK